MTARGRPPQHTVLRVGIWAWSFVGLVAATIIVVVALAAVSEIVFPLVAQIDPSIKGEVDSFVGDSCRILRSYGRGSSYDLGDEAGLGARYVLG